MNIGEAVDTIYQMKLEGRNEFHFSEVAVAITIHVNEYKGCSPDEIKDQVRNYLYNSATKISRGRRVENTEGKYKMVPNGRGGHKAGYYKLRRQRQVRPVMKYPIKSATVAQTDRKDFIGSAGEMAVASELLFREYNISRMSVDDGIDIVAIKNDKTYYIQVKTAHVGQNHTFQIKIRNKSFAKYNDNKCYYVVVARGDRNYFLIFTADDIRRMQLENVISNSDSDITITFKQPGDNHIYIRTHCVDYAINQFTRIY